MRFETRQSARFRRLLWAGAGLFAWAMLWVSVFQVVFQ